MGKLQPAKRRAFAFLGEDIMQNGFAHKLAFSSVQSVPCGNSSCSPGPFRAAGVGTYDDGWSVRELGFHGCVVVMVKVKIAGDKLEGVGRFDRRRITGLACIAASEDAWLNFEREWKQVLLKHGRNISHMVKDHKKDAFTSDRLRVVQGFIGGASEKVCTAISAVSLDDYRGAASHPKLLPRHVCLNTWWCLEQVCQAFPVGRLDIDIVIDQGEPFLDELQGQLRKRSKEFIRHHRVLSRISTLAQSERNCYLVQAADFLAWEINRQRTDLPWVGTGKIRDVMGLFPVCDPNDRYKPHPEGLALLMTTRNKLWVREDFEYYVQCAQGQHGAEGRKFIEPYSLCDSK